MLTTTAIEHILAALPLRTVGLIGDLFLDRYLDLDATLNEPSIETGLLAYQVVNVRSYPGALGTVLNNLEALGVGRIVPISIIGDDGEGYELLREMRQKPSVELAGIVTSADRRTPTYCKPMLNEAGTIRELNRLDTKNRSRTPAELEDAILAQLREWWPKLDALIVLDQVSEQNCGTITDRVREAISECAQLQPDRFVLADSRERIHRFRDVAIKPNEQECLAAVGNLELNALAKLVRGTVFCTRGERGIHVANYSQNDEPLPVQHVPGSRVSGPIDICGAGDSCSAGIVAAILGGCDAVKAAEFGNLVASITIQQLGITGTATPAQVRQRWATVSQT